MKELSPNVVAWLKRLFWAGIGALFAMCVMFFFLVLGVQHGDTYIGNDHPSFWSAAKYVVKKALHEIKNGIYHEATKYNPEGDTIPDSWDDTLINGIKSVF